MSEKRASKPGPKPVGPQHFTLSSYGPVEIHLPPVAVSQADVDQQLQALAQQIPSFDKIEGAGALPDDERYIAIESTHAGEPFTPLTGKRIFKLGEGFMPEEFDKQVGPMLAGETKTFDFEVPWEEGADGQPVMSTITSAVTVLEIRRQITPEITDAWVSQNIPGASSVSELRARIREQLEAQLAQQLEQRKYFLAASVLAERLQGAIPDDVFERALAGNREGFEVNLRKQGITKEQFLAQQGITEHQLTMQNLMQTREMLAQALALDAMADHLGLDVDDDEINAVFGARTPEQTAAARASAESAGRLAEVRDLARRNKTAQWVVGNAKITSGT